jgi:hypothetical protein
MGRSYINEDAVEAGFHALRNGEISAIKSCGVRCARVPAAARLEGDV